MTYEAARGLFGLSALFITLGLSLLGLAWSGSALGEANSSFPLQIAIAVGGVLAGTAILWFLAFPPIAPSRTAFFFGVGLIIELLGAGLRWAIRR